MVSLLPTMYHVIIGQCFTRQTQSLYSEMTDEFHATYVHAQYLFRKTSLEGCEKF